MDTLRERGSVEFHRIILSCRLYYTRVQSQIETVSEQRRDENIKAYFHEVFNVFMVTIVCGTLMLLSTQM